MSGIVSAPGQIVTPDELRAVAADGTKLRYALMELAAQIPDAITLGRGDPDLDTPSHVLEAARKAVLDGRADLPVPVWGLPELREAVAHNLRRDNGIPVDRDGVLITDGGQEALYLVMQTLLNPGDEILVPDPRCTPPTTRRSCRRERRWCWCPLTPRTTLTCAPPRSRRPSPRRRKQS